MDNKNFNKAPHFLLSKTEREHKLHIVYMELRNILGMYKYTDCYNYLPDEEDVADYLKIKLTKIHIMVNVLFEKTEWEEKLHRIVSEVQYFVSRYERPGVVLRWKQLNPNLLFYDSAFQFKEEVSHEAYLKCQRGLTGYRLSLYSDDELIEQRRMYFEHAKNSALMINTTFSEDKLFEEELLKTLDMVFEHDFCTSEIDNKE